MKKYIVILFLMIAGLINASAQVAVVTVSPTPVVTVQAPVVYTAPVVVRQVVPAPVVYERRVEPVYIHHRHPYPPVHHYHNHAPVHHHHAPVHHHSPSRVHRR